MVQKLEPKLISSFKERIGILGGVCVWGVGGPQAVCYLRSPECKSGNGGMKTKTQEGACLCRLPMPS